MIEGAPSVRVAAQPVVFDPNEKGCCLERGVELSRSVEFSKRFTRLPSRVVAQPEVEVRPREARSGLQDAAVAFNGVIKVASLLRLASGRKLPRNSRRQVGLCRLGSRHRTAAHHCDERPPNRTTASRPAAVVGVSEVGLFSHLRADNLRTRDPTRFSRTKPGD